MPQSVLPAGPTDVVGLECHEPAETALEVDMGTVTYITRAGFSIGELVHHRLFDYRGVIVDVHPRFQGSEAWYAAVARSRPPKDKPWYQVLVDGAEHTTYVAERNLEPAQDDSPITHPLLGYFFGRFENGRYVSVSRGN